MDTFLSQVETLRGQLATGELEQRRRDLDVTLAELGDRLGVDDWTVGRWLDGKRRPSAEHLVRLAAILGVDGQP